jgi:hypothetical protein
MEAQDAGLLRWEGSRLRSNAYISELRYIEPSCVANWKSYNPHPSQGREGWGTRIVYWVWVTLALTIEAFCCFWSSSRMVILLP